MLTHLNFQKVYRYSADGVIGLDTRGSIVYANPKAEEMIIKEKNYGGLNVSQFFKNSSALMQPGLVDEEFRLSDTKGEVMSALISSTSYTDAAGETRTYLFIRNISTLKKKENLLAYLNIAAEELAQARETSSALEKISQLIVPKFANWFSIDILKEGKLEELILAHEDSNMIQWARRYREAYPTDLSSDEGAAKVLKTGTSLFVPIITEEMILASIKNAEQLESILRLNLQSVITLPIFNKGTIIGLINFVSCTPGHHFDENDLHFARNLANHIGLALENTRLNEAATNEISRRKQIEQELRESEELFRFLADAIPHKLWTSDPDGGATYYNQGWYDYTGISGFSELKSQIWNTLHPDDREITAVEFPEVIVSGKAATFEQRLRRHDGEYRWHLSRFSPHKDERGRIRLWVGTSTDIHEHKTMQEALVTSEAHFKALAQFNSLPIWQVNAQCKITFVNDAWCTFTGITNDMVTESNWTANIHPDDREATVVRFNTAFEKREPVHLQYRFRHAPSGNYHLILDNTQPIFNPSFQGYIGTMTDIQEQEDARITIQQLMSKKDEFISIASHELRTPLTSIKAFNQLMQRQINPEKQQGFVQKSAEHISRLEKLINDLLDVTKINAGKMLYNFQPFDFGDMLTDTVKTAQHIAPDHELILENVAEVVYNGDRFRLEQVINNFLTNAVKYSPPGKKILINSHIEENHLILSIRDFGIGIDRENLDKLFDRYYRVDNTAMRFEGLGLGLFISSEILKRHKGSFWIESEVGKGSTFFFRLPLAEETDNAQVQRTSIFYQDTKITINCLQDHKLIYADWTGYQDMASVQKGCLLMLEYLKNNQCTRIINDNTHVQGNWSDAVDWVGKEWFPMMEKAGLKYLAHIFSPSIFSQLSAQKTIDIMQGIITTQYFTDIKKAEEWINSCPEII